MNKNDPYVGIRKPPQRKHSGQGPVTAIVQFLLLSWHERLSFPAMPCFRRDQDYALRDAFFIWALGVSVLSFLFWDASSWIRHVLAGWAVYRTIDLCTALATIAFFGTLRRDIYVHVMGRARLRRLLVSIPFNYVELLLLFSVLYLWLGHNIANSFYRQVTSRADAFFLSMTTMTTVGFGTNAPSGAIALTAATVQAIMGVIVLVVLISGLVGFHNRPRSCEDVTSAATYHALHYMWPFVVLVACCVIAWSQWIIEGLIGLALLLGLLVVFHHYSDDTGKKEEQPKRTNWGYLWPLLLLGLLCAAVWGAECAARSWSTRDGVEQSETIDVERLSRDEIGKLIIRKCKGHGLARLVAAVLEAQGYTTHVSPEGPDKGVDILAAPGPLGFGSPKLCVQVKSGDSPVDLPTLNQLIGSMQNVGAEQGLLVSWGGFKSSVDRETAIQFFRVRLWDADALTEELLEQYGRLPAEIRAELPLKQIWTIASQEEES